MSNEKKFSKKAADEAAPKHMAEAAPAPKKKKRKKKKAGRKRKKYQCF